MNIHLVRHGETPYNRDSLALGIADVPLTELGERQAAAVGGSFATEPLDHIYTSPLARATFVARAIAGERGIVVEAREELLELDVGTTEGMPISALREHHGELLREWAGPGGHAVAMPGGESILDLDSRLAPFVEELRRAPHAAVAVVTHNFVLRVLFCRLVGLEVSSFRSVAFDVASISTLSLRNGRVAVRKLNDRCHLESLSVVRDGRSV